MCLAKHYRNSTFISLNDCFNFSHMCLFTISQELLPKYSTKSKSSGKSSVTTSTLHYFSKYDLLYVKPGCPE